MNNQRSTYSWTVVVVALIVFWPVGLFLLFGKLANDRSANFGGGAGLVRFVGGILLFVAILGIFPAFSGEEGVVTGGIIMILLFGFPGFWLSRKGKDMKKKGNTNKQYIDYIINNKINDVAELARRMGVSQDVVINDVNRLINNGMLGRARLNLNTGKIEFPRPAQRKPERPSSPIRDVRTSSNPYRRQEQTQRPRQEYKAFEPKTIRCKSCSANNFVESLPAQCEYCGSSLHE